MRIQISNIRKSFKMFKRSAGLKGAFLSFVKRKYINPKEMKRISPLI